MSLGMELGIGPGDCVKWGPRSPLPKRGQSPQIFGPCLLRPNGWMFEAGTSHGGSLSPGDFVLDGSPLPLRKRGLQIFVPCLLRPNGWMDEGGTWHGGRPQPTRLCVRWGPSPIPKKGAETPSPIFGPFLLWPNGSVHQNATWYGCWPQPRGLCVRWRLSPLSPTKGAEPPPNGTLLYTLLTATDQKPQKNHKNALLTTLTLTFRRC